MSHRKDKDDLNFFGFQLERKENAAAQILQTSLLRTEKNSPGFLLDLVSFSTCVQCVKKSRVLGIRSLAKSRAFSGTHDRISDNEQFLEPKRMINTDT